MILTALQFTNKILDQFLKNTFGLDESKVVINTIVDANGTIPRPNQNKVVISLINIEKETLKPFYVRNKKLVDGSYSNIPLTERYNLDILLTSNFDDYTETLKFLNASILFFQVNAAVDASSYSTIPKEIARLEFEMEKITYHQMHSLWSAMGAKYQPSVIFKTRLVSISADKTLGFDAAISQISNQLSV